MKRLAPITAVLAFAAIGSPAAAAPPAAPPAALARLTTETIVPRFAAVERAARAQQAAWTAFCAARRTADPTPLRNAYGALADAWARIDFMRLGPAESEQRIERFNYWLDRQNAAGKALNAMLAASGPESLSPAQLKAGSAAGQGLPIIERLLYGADADALLRAPGDAGERRCAVGQAVATNLAGLAAEMAAGWAMPDGAAAAIAADRRWGVTFANGQEASRVMLTDLVGGIDVLKDSKVALALHDEANAGAIRLAQDARSGRTLRDIELNFDALRAAVDVYMTPATPAQKKTVADAFDDVRAKLDAVEAAERTTPPHSDQRQAALRDTLASLTSLLQISMNVVPAGAGVPLGFNNLDGD